MSHEEEGRRKCREKTARGNFFKGKRAAKKAASTHSRYVGARMNWFRCKWCEFYHLGSWRSPEERAARSSPEGGGR